MSYTVGPMIPGDLDMVLGWAGEEGWNPGLDDAAAFYAADPTGFLVGRRDGERVAAISVVKYGADFAFLGLYIVRPQWRGQGYGKAIWDAGIESAGSRTIGLDGVVAQQDNYRASGFAIAHRNARWSGVVPGGAIEPRVRSITAEDAAAVETFDRSHFPAPRERFLARWLAPSPSRRSVGYFEEDRILGYGTVRRSVDGTRIGPLFALTADIGEALFAALTSDAGDGPVSIDIPAPNTVAADMASRAGLTPSFETARMYRGAAPTLPLEQIFGITSLELG